MSWQNMRWLFFSGAVFLWSSARACEAPAGTNFSDQPRYWCSSDAQVLISTGCDIAVEEIIRVPWTTGVLDRSIPTEDSQRIEDVSAYRLLSGIRAANLSATQRRDTPNNWRLSVQVGRVTEPVSVLITYKKIGGVQIFSRCSGVDIFEPVHNSEANTVMLSEWAFGGRSISEVQHVAVTFFLQTDRKLEYIDTQTTVSERFQRESKNNANAAGDRVSVSYNGSTAGLSPSQLIFYIRYFMLLGAQSCPVSRNCQYESMILNEGQSSELKQRIIIGVSLTLALICVGGIVAALVLYCKRAKEGQLNSNVEENLPESLRHFEYDTGGDQTGEKRAEQVWMSNKSNEMKEEIYAVDLSPRNRGKKDSEGL